MTSNDIIRFRLYNQQLLSATFRDPVTLLQYMGAVQAQDYAASKWALALRLKATTERQIEQAINDGRIIRTHILRPTWHYVAAGDIRWMLELSGPRVQAFNAPMYRRQGLDAAVFRRSYKAMEKALQGNQHLTRNEIAEALQKAKIDTGGLRLVLLLMQAELEGLICNGARRGKQFTYALLEDRVPQSSAITRDEALTKLALTYFRSRGPATPADFAWWSGLTMKDAKNAVEALKKELIAESIENTTYWMHPGTGQPPERPVVALLPAYDEYAIAYKDRSALLDPELPAQTPLELLSPQIMINGLLSGTWKRTIKKDKAEIGLKPLKKMGKAEMAAVRKEMERYNEFLK